jgi:hypothetical protein
MVYAPALRAFMSMSGNLDGLKDGDPLLVSHLFVLTGLCKSRSEAARLIRGGGAYLNNRRLTPPDELVFDYDLLHGHWLILRKGKKDVAAVEFTIDPAPEQHYWLEWSEPVRPVGDEVRRSSSHAGEVHET